MVYCLAYPKSATGRLALLLLLSCQSFCYQMIWSCDVTHLWTFQFHFTFTSIDLVIFLENIENRWCAHDIFYNAIVMACHDAFRVFEPRMAPYLLKRGALLRIHLEDALYQVAGIRINIVWQFILCWHNWGLQIIYVLILERQVTAKHGEQSYTGGPQIHRDAFVRLTF